MFLSKKLELNLLVTAIMLFVLRMAVPFMICLFIPYFILFSTSIIVKYWNINDKLKHVGIIAKMFLPFLVISGILIIAYIFSIVQPIPILKDILHIAVIISLIIVLFLEINNTSNFKEFEWFFSIQIITFSSVISLLGLIKFYLYLRGIVPQFLGHVTPYCTTLTTDYNFYSLAGIIGFIFVCRILLDKTITSRIKVLMQVLLFTISLNIILSSSRRGFTVFLFLLLGIISFSIYRFFRTKFHYKSFNFFLIFIGIFIFLLSLFFAISNNQKLIVARMLKFNISSLNTSTSELIIRYSTILELNNRENIVKFINGKPDSRYPYTGWGTRVYTDVFPLKGDNVEIIPIDAVGYRMDSTCNASTWNNNAYSFTNILNLLNNIEDNSRVFCASVYCYVSKDFNGNWARISAEGNLQGNTSIDYDLTKKGVWQKLKIIFTSSNGIPPVYLYWSKYGVIDFKTLKGYVLFAYPEYKSVKIDSKDPASWGTRMYTKVDSIKFGNAEIIPKNSIGYKMDSTCNASTWGNSSYSYTNISCLFQGDTTKTNSEYYCASVYCYLSEDFNGTWARISAEGNSQGNKLKEYDLLRKGTWQKLQIEFTSTKSIPPVYLYWSKNGVTDFKTLKGYVIFAYPEYKKISKPQAQIELNNTNITYHRSITQASIISSTAISDLLEKLKQLFKSNEVLSDTTSIKNDNFKVKIENELIGERTERWRYGWYLFKNKYTWQQKIFGNGFDYFQKFGDKFDKGNYDWPHNPIISSFLYSGLIGGIAFIWFLMLVVVNYVIYIKHHFFFFISFLVTFFFVFFSDYSLFNTPMFTFLCIIPFFTKYLSLKDEYGDIKNIPMKRILLW